MFGTWCSLAHRYAGLDCYLILRNTRSKVDSDPGLVGNLLVERLVGAHVHQACVPRPVLSGCYISITFYLLDRFRRRSMRGWEATRLGRP